MDIESQLSVLNTLRRACSQEPTELKPAEKLLKSWETQAGFYNILSTISLNHDIEVNVRWLAVLLFKNGIERYWRRNAPNAIPEEEKRIIKTCLIQEFSEPAPQIATQLAVLIGKIARIECPRYWPELIPTLLQAVRCHDNLPQHRAILTLHHVTKTLASKCLPADRQLFTEMTSQILGYIVDLWSSDLSQFFQFATDYNDEGMAKSIERVTLTSKVIRKQIVFGFKEFHSSQVAVSFISALFTKLPEILACRHTLWGNHMMLAKCERLVLLLTKILLETHEHHATSFIPFIVPSLNFVLAFTFHESTGNLRFERFTVNTLNLMKAILSNERFRVSNEGGDNPNVGEARQTIDNFFTLELLTEMCQRLVTHYFLLKCDDLLGWDSDPEGYAQDEIGDSYKFSLRPCTEVLLLALFKSYRATMSAVLIDLVKTLVAPCDPDDMPAMLRKEAVYNAVGLASFDLFDDIDFDSWFTSQLLPELTNQHNNYRIIRRRVIRLVGQWVSVKLSVTLRPALYEAIVPLLQPTEDLVVRLEAANTLKCVDDFEFKTDIFLPYLNMLFGQLFQLLRDVCECDSKMSVLHVISFVIERVGSHIVPYAPTLIQYLPTLWQDAQEHNMLRCAIVSTLIHLVQGLKSSCTDMFDFIIPVIRMSTDVTQSPHVYLMEDGLDLWLSTLHNAHTPTPLLLELFTNMPSLLELGTENLAICLRITDAYILLGGDQFLAKFSDSLVASLTSLISDVKYEGLFLILKVIDSVLTLYTTEGVQLFHTILTNAFSSTLQKQHDYPIIVPVYISLFARIVVSNQQTFLNFLAHVASQFNKNREEMLAAFLDAVFEHLDITIECERRKLVALAVVSLLPLNLSVVLERFGLVVNMCVEVLHDVNRPQLDSTTYIDSLLIVDGSESVDIKTDDHSDHDHRNMLLRRRDPVYTTELRGFIRDQFSACRQKLGEASFASLMAGTDSEVVNQLQCLLT